MTDDILPEQPDRDTPGRSPEERTPAELPPGSDAPAIEQDLEAIRRELARTEDRLLRTAAEFDNYRKRTERERREQTDRTVASLLLDFLAVVDDLERALSAGDGTSDVAGYRRGVELIHAAMLDLLRRRNVTPLASIGTTFDPNVHQAVAVVAADGRADGEVVEETRRGYLIGDALLRPAMVKVARS